MFSKLFPYALALGPSLLQVTAAPCGPASKAIYILSNEAANEVVALPIGLDGKLSGGTRAATKGAGANAIDGMTNGPAAPDALVSQAALTVSGNSLFAVNAGSNTITMFNIDPADPTKLSMVGKPVTLPGEFPNTVAASDEKKLVCVGMTGAVAGVSCASFSSKKGMGAMDALRPFDLQQKTPPLGPTNTVSHVFFSDDQNTLYATVKGDPSKNNTGFLASFAVEAGSPCGMDIASVSAQEMKSSPEGTAVLFGSAPIPESTDIFVTDASFGAAVLSIEPATGAATVKGRGAIDGQAATCWAAFSPATGTAFVTDVAMNRLVEMSVKDASIVGTIDLTANGDPGLIDLRAAGDFVYALSPGNGKTQAAVVVVDTETKQQVQHFQLNSLGLGKNAMGMALFTKK